MTWKELQREITDLGFEKADALERNKNIIRLAVNRALTVLASSFRGVRVCEEVDFDGETVPNLKETDSLFLRYASPCLTDKDFYAIPCRLSPLGFILTDHIGSAIVNYERGYEKIAADDADSKEIPLDEESACLLPLLASFYVWQDDDERKAVRYRNDYESLKAQFLSRELQKPVVNAGEDI